MIFESNEERMQHPQISIIPANMWTNPDSLWNSQGHSHIFDMSYLELSDEIILLIKTIQDDPQRLLPYLRENLTVLKTINKRVGLIIALTIPELDESSLKEIGELLNLPDKLFFNLCVDAGNIQFLKLLSNKHQGTGWVETVIVKNRFAVFRNAAEYDHLDVLQYLQELMPYKIEDMIMAGDCGAFRHAVVNGNLKIVQYLIEQAPDKTQAMIAKLDYIEFATGLISEDPEFVQYLIELAPDNIGEMVAKFDHSNFCKAIELGALKILQYLTAIEPHKFETMLEESNYFAFRRAVKYGGLKIVQHLAEQYPHMLENMVEAEDYGAFRGAAKHGNLEVLQYLAEQCPNLLEDMTAARDYCPVTGAASYGHLKIIQYLAERLPNQLEDMLEADDCGVFREAASEGYLDILQYLAELAPHKLQEMIEAGNYCAINLANSFSHDEVVQFLLPGSFPHVEPHQQEYDQYIRPFIEKSLSELRSKKTQYGEVSILLNAQEAKQLFYLARALIRRHAPLEDLRLVLELPEVRELAHRAVTPGHSNELLRLAITSNNQEAFNYLLSIPAVEQEARANNFYVDEYEGRLNLRMLAQNRESSLTALSPQENANLDKLTSHYLAKDNRSWDEILEELRTLLIQRYEVDPAMAEITNSNGEIRNLVLPWSWEEFTKLPLSKEERIVALEAYYQNKNHSAWRFLAKPNPWMHPRAPYTNSNESGEWSAFEEYKKLIAILFLAAIDKENPGVDGYSVDDRVTQFIDELGLIGRAHNWDKKNEKGKEYDDLTGDKPSCYSGTKRRLFQSVQGHPLLKLLTWDILQQELQEFVWNHFQKAITPDNRQSLYNIWQKKINIETLTSEEENTLFETNISKKEQAAWIEKLCDKHGDQVHHFKNTLLQKFNLSEDSGHFIHFAYLNLAQLLKNPASLEDDTQTSLDSTIKALSQTNIFRLFQGQTQQDNNRISNSCTANI